jgi:prepilin-type N-terminal cleavage/methylation domain-containing protein
MNRPLRHRRAFTLLELLIVLALLVAIAAIATPAVVYFSHTQQLRHSGELIRAAWARARVQAMKSGRVHVFRYEPDGSHYSIDYWMADDDALEAGDDSALREAQPDAADLTAPDPELTFDDSSASLADGVRFFVGQTLADARSAQVEAEIAASEPATANASQSPWSPPVLFYSDGTTSPAEIVLVNRRNHAVRISLRGLTGVVHVSDVFTMEKASP